MPSFTGGHRHAPQWIFCEVSTSLIPVESRLFLCGLPAFLSHLAEIRMMRGGAFLRERLVPPDVQKTALFCGFSRGRGGRGGTPLPEFHSPAEQNGLHEEFMKFSCESGNKPIAKEYRLDIRLTFVP